MNWTAASAVEHAMPILETLRLVVREFSPDDADALARVSPITNHAFLSRPFDRADVETGSPATVIATQKMATASGQ